MIKTISAVILFAVLATSPHQAYGQTKYKLNTADVLVISVYGQDDLLTKTRVGPDGYITFPLLGKVQATSLTAQELEAEIKRLLETDYLVSAQVTVFIEEYHPRQVSVIGEVNTPGKFDMPQERDLTLLDAIAMAEGFTKDALLNKVKVIRTSGTGGTDTMVVDVKAIINKKNEDNNIVLQPDDIVVVPESSF